MIKVNFSRNDDPAIQIKQSLKIISEIDSAFDKREIIELDLSEVKWILPCSAILISGKLRDLISKGADINFLPPQDGKTKEWLSNIGFPLGKSKDGLTYISIKHFVNNPSNPNQVNEEANSLLEKIQNKIPNSFGSSIPYLLGELSDNVDQHSNFTHSSLMAQYYPHKNHVDIAVFDNGISVPLNFEKNKISFKNDSEAIKKALFGEVTTKKDEKMRAYGLKTCKNIAHAIEGELYFISRRGIAILRNYEEEFYDFENVSLDGTFIYLRLPTPKNKINIYSYVEG